MNKNLPKDIENETVFNEEKFTKRLLSHRKDVYKRTRTPVATKRFLKQYDNLNDDEKERIFIVTQILINSKVPTLLGDHIDDVPDAEDIKGIYNIYVVDMCGLRVFITYSELFESVRFYKIEKSHSEIYQVRCDNGGFDRQQKGWHKTHEDILALHVTKWGFDSLYEIELYAKENNMSIKEVIESRGGFDD